MKSILGERTFIRRCMVAEVCEIGFVVSQQEVSIRIGIQTIGSDVIRLQKI